MLYQPCIATGAIWVPRGAMSGCAVAVVARAASSWAFPGAQVWKNPLPAPQPLTTRTLFPLSTTWYCLFGRSASPSLSCAVSNHTQRSDSCRPSSLVAYVVQDTVQTVQALKGASSQMKSAMKNKELNLSFIDNLQVGNRLHTACPLCSLSALCTPVVPLC